AEKTGNLVNLDHVVEISHAKNSHGGWDPIAHMADDRPCIRLLSDRGLDEELVTAQPGFELIEFWYEHRDVDPETHDIRASLLRHPIVAWGISLIGDVRPISFGTDPNEPRNDDACFYGVLCPNGGVFDPSGNYAWKELDDWIGTLRKWWKDRLVAVTREAQAANECRTSV
ncbi:hypothetical protein, partial [Methyloceanibacter marginalis]|uniref:hypothetical protein n=1 Tax=Methyloceanibacter marginalis TaxID=1774971 RepID=UPI001301964B